MGRVTAVGVKELKNRLSAYLKEVQAGTVVLVTDRGTVVAELREPTLTSLPASGTVAEEWVQRGLLRPPLRLRAAGAFPVEPVRTLDALHLASALELLRVHPDISVLSFGRRILDNLPALGLGAA